MMIGGVDQTTLSLKDVCEMPDMPELSAVLYWFKKDFSHYDEFMEMYEFARQMQTEVKLDRIDEISQRATDKDNAYAIQVQLQQLRWEAAKHNPARFGKESEKLENVKGIRKKREIMVTFKNTKAPSRPPVPQMPKEDTHGSDDAEKPGPKLVKL